MIRVRTDISGITKLLAELTDIEASNTISGVVRGVALNTLAEVRQRIQNRGEATDGSEIGQYSRKPAYFSLSRSSNRIGRPIGKTGKSKFKSGADHKSRYFPDGYFGWKSRMGANTLGTVNLTLTGTMMNSLSVIQTSKGWGVGWLDPGFPKRARGFEKKYGKRIFHASETELAAAKAEAERLIKDAIS